MDNEKDIFDKLMSLKIFGPFLPLWQKHREALLYLFFGVLTTAVNMVVFFALNAAGVNELVSNAAAWVLAVLFAYVTNSIWVFRQKGESAGDKLRQIFSFYAGRVATLLFEEAALYIFITKLSFAVAPVKIAAQIAVIVLNYIISKLLVFTKKGNRDNG